MESMPLKKISDEVFVAVEPIVRLDWRAVELVRDLALRNPRGRARICAHRHAGDPLHQMLIGISAASYVRPHRHPGKSESFHVVEGQADVAIFSGRGAIEDVVSLGPLATFFYRLDAPRYHAVLVCSPVVVIHETTNGPFDPTQTDWAPFAPAEGTPEAEAYMTWLRRTIAAWKVGCGSDGAYAGGRPERP